MASTVLTRVELDAERIILTGSFRVDHILVCNATGSAIEVIFNDADGTEILSIAVPANDSFGYEVSWIAGNGLVAETEGDAAVSVTVAHSATGV